MFLGDRRSNGLRRTSVSDAGRSKNSVVEQESLQDELSSLSPDAEALSAPLVRSYESSLTSYLREMGRLPLTTLGQEQILSASRIQEQAAAVTSLLGSQFITRMCLKIIKQAQASDKYLYRAIDTQIKNRTEIGNIRKKLVVNSREAEEIVESNHKAFASLLSRRTDDAEKLKLRSCIDDRLRHATTLFLEVKLKPEIIKSLSNNLHIVALEAKLLHIRLRAAHASGMRTQNDTNSGASEMPDSTRGRMQRTLEREYRTTCAKLREVSGVSSEIPMLILTHDELSALRRIQRTLRTHPQGTGNQRQTLERINSIIATSCDIREVTDTFRDLDRIKSGFDSIRDFNRFHEKLLTRAEELQRLSEMFFKLDEPVSCEELRAMRWALRRRLLMLGESPQSALDRVAQADHHWAKLQEARDKLVKGNLRLVVTLSKRYRDCGLEFIDLIAAGNVGLMRAAARFDSSPGYRFATYAVYWIRCTIEQAIAETGNTIRIPARMFEHVTSFRRRESDESMELSRKLNAEDSLRAYTLARGGLSPFDGIIGSADKKLLARRDKELQLLKIATAPILSFALPGKPSGKRPTTLGASIAAPMKDETQAFELSELKNLLQEKLAHLTKREHTILTLRFGMGPNQTPHTLEEIGIELGLTRERVRQIEKTALQKLREALPQGESLL
jgi:RNA polymerase sigma factor (sigma-70 family)